MARVVSQPKTSQSTTSISQQSQPKVAPLQSQPKPAPQPTQPTITPQQSQQMSQTLSALTRSLQNISSTGLGTMTPTQRTQLSTALGSLSPLLGQAEQIVRGAIQQQGQTPAPAPAPTPTPTPTPTPSPVIQELPAQQTTVQSAQDELLKELRRVQEEFKEEMAQKPEVTGLTPEEKAVYAAEQEQLRKRYEQALEALRRQQAKEQERLLGRYAAMGFSEPGVIAGPMASEPGVATKAFQDVKERQQRELTELEQAREGGLLALTRAEQEAEIAARERARQDFERKREAMLRNLQFQLGLGQSIYELQRPERVTVGNRLFERDKVTGQWREVLAKPEEAKEIKQETQIDDEGNVYLINPYTGEMRRIGKITKKTGSGKEEDKKLTPTQAKEYGVPFGTTESQLESYFISPYPPQWFKKQIEEQYRASFLPEELQKLWDKARKSVLGGVSKSGGKGKTMLPGEEEL